jgi:hypothetical protein
VVTLNKTNGRLKMKKSSILVTCSVAFISITALSVAPAIAQQKTEKACRAEWQAHKTDNQAKGITEKAYVAECRKGATAKPATTTTEKTPKAASTAAKPKDGHEAEVARERACAQEWKADKAANKVPAGMKWPQYWSACDKRKKAAGM